MGKARVAKKKKIREGINKSNSSMNMGNYMMSCVFALDFRVFVTYKS